MAKCPRLARSRFDIFGEHQLPIPITGWTVTELTDFINLESVTHALRGRLPAYMDTDFESDWSNTDPDPPSLESLDDAPTSSQSGMTIE